MNIIVELSFLIATKDMREEQKRFYQLTLEAKKKRLPELWKLRKECLENCRQMESLVDSRLESILTPQVK
jgi:hypothetical protein